MNRLAIAFSITLGALTGGVGSVLAGPTVPHVNTTVPHVNTTVPQVN